MMNLDAFVDPHFARAQELVDWIANIFADGRRLHPHEVEILERLTAASQPAGTGDKAVLAEQIVAEHAARYRESTRPGYQGNSTGEIIDQLIVELWSMVDVRFGFLHEKPDEVKALLDDFSRDHRRGARSLLVKLNELAGKPLTTYSFSGDTVKSAKRRKNKAK